MKYRPRDGIVTTKICDMMVLIPSRAASEYCNTIQPLPLLWYLTWQAIIENKPFEILLKAHKILTKRTDDDIIERINKFCDSLCQKGFLEEIPEETI